MGGKSGNRKVIALTGGIGSGKSTVGRMLAALGAEVIDADDLAREVVAPHSVGLQAIVATFGPGVINERGELDRKKVGELVFTDKILLEKLNNIVHPLVRTRFQELLDAAQQKPSATPIVYLIPLLFESGIPLTSFDLTVCVNCPDDKAQARVMQRDNCSADAYQARKQAQLPVAEKCARSDKVINNDGDLAALESEVHRFWRELGQGD